MFNNIRYLEKYPVTFRGKRYTVSISESDDYECHCYRCYEVKVFPGKRSIFPVYKRLFPICNTGNDFIKLVNDTMASYAKEVLNAEAKWIAAKKAFNEWDGVVKED